MTSGTYEVFIDVRSHPRHSEQDLKHSTGFKLVDTGDPRQMVADALRTFADEIAPSSVPDEVEKVLCEAHDWIRHRVQGVPAVENENYPLVLRSIDSVLNREATP